MVITGWRERGAMGTTIEARRTLFSAAKDKALRGMRAARPGECLSQGLWWRTEHITCGDAQRGCQDVTALESKMLTESVLN